MRWREQIHEGMKVRDGKGQYLGRVVARGDNRFLVEKGVFFRDDYSAPYDQVLAIVDEEVCLSVSEETLTQPGRSELEPVTEETVSHPPPDEPVPGDDEEITQKMFLDSRAEEPMR